MALPNWGELQKSQDDPETIEQAIARIVGEHDDDPMSHNDEGQALQSHKSYKVIDHPQGSVVADKKSASDVVFDVLFTSVEGFDHTGSGYVDAVDFKLRMEVDSGHSAVFLAAVPFTEGQLDAPRSLILEAPCYFQDSTNSTALLDWHFMEFQIEHGRVRGYNLQTDDATDWYSVNMIGMHVLRAIYFNDQQKIKFFVDGDLIGELDFEWELEPTDMYVGVYHTRHSADDIFYVNKLYFGVFSDVPPS